jgi:RNA polymerase sigma factor FliA
MNAECATMDSAIAVEQPSMFLKRAWESYTKNDHGGELENDLVKQYLPLVRSVVGRLAMTLPTHVHQEDLYSPGLVGLLKAIRNYDASQSSAFECYARYRIRGAVLDELRRMDWVPRSVHDKAKKVERVIVELEAENHSMPEEEQIAEALDLSLGEYHRLMEEIRPVAFVSINGCNEYGGPDEPFKGINIEDDETPGPDEMTSKLELIERIKEKIEELPDRMKKVLAFYYYENMRLKEIAAILGVTEARVCQIHSEAILLIRSLARDL